MSFTRSTLLLLILLPTLHALSAPASQPASPVELFQSRLDALADLKNLQAHFTCRRDIAGIDTPLLSAGTLWIRAGHRKPAALLIAPGAGGAVHIRTSQPYSSDTILLDGKFIGRTQHEARWQLSEQSSRPGLTAAIGQIAGWCIGDPGKLTDWFTIAQPPQAADQPETFTLTPRNADLGTSVRTIAVRFDARTHYLVWARLTTTQDDQSTYEFSDLLPDAKIPADIFRYDQL